MRLQNLNDDPSYWEQRRTRALEGAAPIGFSSVTRGGLRIASEEGLRVEGSIYGAANEGTGQPAHIEWDGTASFTGDVRSRLFRVQDGPFVAEFNRDGMHVEGDAYLIGPDGSKTPTPFAGNLNGSGFSMERQGRTSSISPDYLRVDGLPSKDSKTGMRMVLFDPATGTFYHSPISFGGGDPGDPGGPYLGGWPVAPYSRVAFTDNNWDGESDYGERHTGKGWHDGIDFSGHDATDSSPVRAIGPGVVIEPSTYDGIYGWAGGSPVVIRHDQISEGSLAGKTIYSVYAHMWTATVSPGQRVDTLQQVGTMGDDGQSYGSHLHLEIHIGALYMYGDPGVGGSQDPVPIFDEYAGWAAL